MILQAQSTCETYYDVLDVKEDASYEEIRRGYRLAAFQSHPDKSTVLSNVSSLGDDVGDKFVKVQQAWETLSDSTSRSLYDHNLRSLRNDVLVADDVALEDMVVKEDTDVLELCYHCRCGGEFMISCSELEEMGLKLCIDVDKVTLQNTEALTSSVILPCCSCSLNIRVFINMDSSG